jgi:mycofactocin precursor
MAEHAAELTDDDAMVQPAESPGQADQEPVITDLLVEEVSIDGMCGVY